MSAKKAVKKVTKKAVSKTPVKKTVSTKKSMPVKKSTPVKKAPAKTPTAPVSKPVVKKEMMAKKIDAKKLIKPLIFLLILAGIYLLKDELIVASVNGKPVSRFALIRSLEQQSGSTVLENITLQMLVEQELKKADVEVTEEELDTEINMIEEQLAAQGQNLDDLLTAQGLTRKTVREQLSLSKGMEKLLADKVSVSDEEIVDYFEQNKDLMGDVVFEDIRSDIENQLRQEKMNTEQQKWFAEIRKNSKINYFKFAPSTNL